MLAISALLPAATLVVVLLANNINIAGALPSCNSEVVKLPGNKLTFAIVGDWGRVGAENSLFAPYTVELCKTTGMCCSDLQEADLTPNFDYSDVLDGPQQRMAATLLNEVCGDVGCQFVLGMGDNFYPCGADSLESGLNRFQSDWEAIYQSDATPHLQGLSWYSVFGNHDYGFNFSVNEQIAYGSQDPRWVTPSSYFSRTFVAGETSMKVEFLDETPFIQKYAVPGTAYYTNYLAEKMTADYLNTDAAAYMNATSGLCEKPPANASFINSISDSATGQIPWLKSCLMDNSSTWDVVVGHYALYGSDVNWAYNNSKSGYPGNCGAWGSLAALVKEYAPQAYFNGHDHTSTHADPMRAGVLVGAEPSADGYGNVTYLVSASDLATQYFTQGNGGSIQYADGVTLGLPKSFNNFSNVIYNENVQYSANTLSDSAAGNAAVGEGFAIAEVDECTMTVKFFTIQDYDIGQSATPVHTAVIDQCGTATVSEATE